VRDCGEFYTRPWGGQILGQEVGLAQPKRRADKSRFNEREPWNAVGVVGVMPESGWVLNKAIEKIVYALLDWWLSGDLVARLGWNMISIHRANCLRGPRRKLNCLVCGSRIHCFQKAGHGYSVDCHAISLIHGHNNIKKMNINAKISCWRLSPRLETPHQGHHLHQ
jgi:hypothetical protein